MDYAFPQHLIVGLGAPPPRVPPPAKVAPPAPTPKVEVKPAPPAAKKTERERGVGAVFQHESADYMGGNIGIVLLNKSVAGAWIPIATSDGNGQNINGNGGGAAQQYLSDHGNLTNALSQHQVAPTLVSQWSSGAGRVGGYLYFGLFDPNGGAAWTPGEPAGAAIMRFKMTGGSGSNNAGGTGHFDVLTLEGATSAAPGPGGAIAPAGTVVVVPLKVGVPTITTWQNASPGMPGYYWYGAAWVYSGSQPPTSAPPGAQPNPGGWLGAWVGFQPTLWVWFPAGPPNTSLQMMLGGDKNTYSVYSSWRVASGANPPSNLPPPTAPPQPGLQGAWQNPFPGYYVFVPTGLATTATTTSYTWLWVALGIVVVGGVGYYLLD